MPGCLGEVGEAESIHSCTDNDLHQNDQRDVVFGVRHRQLHTITPLSRELAYLSLAQDSFNRLA